MMLQQFFVEQVLQMEAIETDLYFALYMFLGCCCCCYRIVHFSAKIYWHTRYIKTILVFFESKQYIVHLLCIRKSVHVVQLCFEITSVAYQWLDFLMIIFIHIFILIQPYKLKYIFSIIYFLQNHLFKQLEKQNANLYHAKIYFWHLKTYIVIYILSEFRSKMYEL